MYFYNINGQKVKYIPPQSDTQENYMHTPNGKDSKNNCGCKSGGKWIIILLIIVAAILAIWLLYKMISKKDSSSSKTTNA